MFPVSLSAKVKEEVLFKCVLFKCRHMCEFILFSTVLCCKCRGQGSFWGVSTVFTELLKQDRRETGKCVDALISIDTITI